MPGGGAVIVQSCFFQQRKIVWHFIVSRTKIQRVSEQCELFKTRDIHSQCLVKRRNSLRCCLTTLWYNIQPKHFDRSKQFWYRVGLINPNQRPLQTCGKAWIPCIDLDWSSFCPDGEFRCNFMLLKPQTTTSIYTNLYFLLWMLEQWFSDIFWGLPYQLRDIFSM